MQELQNLGKQMQDGFATESCRRQEDYKKMEEAMTTKMEEGFRNEQQAREQAQKEIMDGGTVGSEVSTAVGRGPSGTYSRPPQGVAVRLNDLFMPRRMEFKGWVTDYKQCRYKGPQIQRF